MKSYDDFKNESMGPKDWDPYNNDFMKEWTPYKKDLEPNKDLEWASDIKRKGEKMDLDDIEKIAKSEIKDKEKKVFQVGDVIKCINNKPNKSLPQDALEFILTYKKFTVLDVSDKLNIDLGHKLENGNPYYFSSNRFELIDGKAPTKKIERTPEELKKLEILKMKRQDSEKKYKKQTPDKPIIWEDQWTKS